MSDKNSAPGGAVTPAAAHTAETPDASTSGVAGAEKVWLVWTEQGEYENWSRDLRGVFVDKSLADGFAAELGTAEVVEVEVLTSPPVKATFYARAARVLPDGTTEPGFLEGAAYRYGCWVHEEPLKSRTSKWSSHDKPDLYIEATGHDRDLVEAEYERLLAEARRTLSEAAQA